jgi:hypothetical protein
MTRRGGKGRPQAAEVVYFVGAAEAVKIGRTRNVAARLRSLATASAVPLALLGTVPGDRQLEARLHWQWRHLRLRGEWFRADQALCGRFRSWPPGGRASS